MIKSSSTLNKDARSLKDSKNAFKDRDIFVSAFESEINRVPALMLKSRFLK